MNNIELYSIFIQFLCELLNLKSPIVYIVKYQKDNIVLYDDKLNIISYDEKDVGKRVRDVTIIPKQNTLYINSEFSSDTLKTLILISKRLRFMYQIKQVSFFIRGESIEIDKELAEHWKYEFTPSQNQKKQTCTNQITPAELDRKAFARIIMGTVFEYNICFEIETGLKDNERGYYKAIDRVREVYSKELIELTLRNYIKIEDFKKRR